MKNILVVDNDKIFLRLMSRMLEKEGYQVETVVDGLNALDILKTYTPDVIFVDLVMPNIGGRTLCKMIRGMEKFKNTPLIILSATSAEEMADFTQLDVNACIAKGTFSETAQNILSVLNQSNLPSRRCLPGDVVGITNVYPRGITKELLSVKKHFEIMLDRMSEVILEINFDGRIIYANSAAFSLIEMPEKDMLGLYFVDLFSEGDRQRISGLMKMNGAKSKAIIENTPVRLNRSQVTLQIIPLGKDDGTSIIILHDVTERKKSEEALRESEARHRLLLEVSPDPIVLYDIEGRAIYVNPVFEQTFGWSLPEIRGKRIDFVPEANWSETKHAIDRTLQGEKVKLFDTRRLTKDGRILDIQLSASIFRDRNGKPAGNIVILRDVTALKQAEEALQKAHYELEQRVEERTFELLSVNRRLEKEIAERKRVEATLRESEKKYRLLAENASDMIWTMDMDLNFTYISPAIEKIQGWGLEEAASLTINDVLTPQSMDKALKRFDAHLADGAKKGNYNINDRFELELYRKNGTTIWSEVSVSFILSEDGKPVGILGVTRDITDRKKLEDQLLQAHKMEAVGTLAGGIAHDFNNILSIIVGNTELAMYDVPEWNPAHQNMLEIHKACLRARDVVRQMLAFSRQTKYELKPVNIAQLIIDSVKLIRASIPSTIEIQTNIKSDSDVVQADLTQINQVLINLCANAAHAMKDKGGVLVVSLDNFEIGKNSAAVDNELHPGKYVRLSVNDTGYGIMPEIMERIFDPYFTTKGVGEGSGMGLAVVHGIVKNHGGKITAESEPGKGTRFDVIFPIVDMEPKPEIKLSGKLPRGKERILFVDDEKSIVNSIKPVLERIGYKVDTRIDSSEALEVFRNNPNAFDLIITDQTMPKLTGEDLAKKILAIRPDIPVILCTGFSAAINEEKAKVLGIRAFIMKPLVLNEIAKIIRNTLDNTE